MIEVTRRVVWLGRKPLSTRLRRVRVTVLRIPGIYATDAQVSVLPEGGHQLQADIGVRLDEAVNALVSETLRQVPQVAGRFAPVPFAQVRCSV